MQKIGMSTQRIFWIIIILALMIWGGVVLYYLWVLKKATPTPDLRPLSISSIEIATSSLPQFSPAVDNWQESRSEKYGFLFRHPDWIKVEENSGTNESDFLPFIANWLLLDQQRNKVLVAIHLTNLTTAEIQQQFPDLSLTPYLNGNLPGGYARPFVGQNLYILSKSDNQNFLINGHFTGFKETLGEEATAKLIEEIVGSIKLI